ncbi:hypothetical protein ABH908_000371 [Pseudomonas frederiksbergensis]|uniref:hypothetical protein n=1 Tax=Pseudomonas TaxID=286 RepID=UPI003D1A005B
MFYGAIEQKFKTGAVSVGLHPVGFGDEIFIEARGMTGVLVKFLNPSEKRKLADLAKTDAEECKRRMVEYQSLSQAQRDSLQEESKLELRKEQERLVSSQRKLSFSLALAMLAICLSLYFCIR